MTNLLERKASGLLRRGLELQPALSGLWVFQGHSRSRVLLTLFPVPQPRVASRGELGGRGPSRASPLEPRPALLRPRVEPVRERPPPRRVREISRDLQKPPDHSSATA